MDEKLIFMYCRSFEKSEYNNLVIIADTESGESFKLTKECFEILDTCISKQATVGECLSWFQDKEDREYFEKILESLYIRKILVSEKQEYEYDISLVLTDRCNLKCIHCCVDADYVADSDCGQDEMTTQEWKETIDKLSELKMEMISFTGGEALIRKDFFEIADYSKSKISTLYQLMSNALLVNENNAERLVSLFDDFSFSLDGVDEESCSFVRGKGVFGRVMESIDILKRHGMSSFSLSMTKIKQNIPHVERFKELCDSLGAQSILRNYDFVGRAKHNEELIPYNADEDFAPIILESAREDGTFESNMMPPALSCGALITTFTIASNGDIFPCNTLQYSKFKVGNVKEITSLKDFIENRAFVNTEGYKNFCNIHPIKSEKCKDCPVKLYCVSCLQYSHLQMENPMCEHYCERKKKELAVLWD